MTAIDELAATAGFPNSSEETFPGTRQAVADVRQWLRKLLDGVPVDMDDVLVAASELVTNAVEYSNSRGGSFRVIVGHNTDYVQVVVLDDGPLAVPPDNHGRDGGRGLLIVSQLAQACGWETYSTGRIAWFRIHLIGDPE
ncbi:ATP-binding protein [Actinoallomurus purpureus]|uniref:ATP-binding protein n=1 Tax=Actinoallomurus purpureus TaxID=478114 RepID=UPI0020929C8F|nr:ATP-binding protein [Actinoallomurus purpureus]MCO6011480.1 ATP-binding protein [Actinoallomurus purpureus]